MQSALPDDLDLDWLHDSVVKGIVYEANADGRNIKIFLHCPRDAGYTPWQGKSLVFGLYDIAAMTHTVWGVRGDESIDSVRPQVSPSFRERTIIARRKGNDLRNFEVEIAFHSGSGMEVLCADVRVEVAAESQEIHGNI